MKKIPFILVFIFCSLVAHMPIYAAETELQQVDKFDIPPDTKSSVNQVLIETDHQAVQFRYKQMEERRFYVIVLSILSFSSLLAVLFLMWKLSTSGENIVLVLGLNLVVFGTIISVIAVDTQEQLAAVTGILGAIGGYLFGSKGRGEFNNKKELNKSNE